MYIEEVADPRAIVAAPTAVTAFLGRTRWGAVAQPVMVTSPGQFARDFGGAWPGSALPGCVDDFFANGGSTAVVVRLFAGDPEAARSALDWDGLTLVAADPGSWGAGLRVRVTHDARAPRAELGEGPDDLFTLHVTDGRREEVHADVTVSRADHPRHLRAVLADESRLVRLGPAAAMRPRPRAHEDPPAGVSLWTSDASSTGVAAGAQHPGADGDPLIASDFLGAGPDQPAPALAALDRAGPINLVVIPAHLPGGDVDPLVVSAVHRYCAEHQAILVLDCPAAWRSAGTVTPARIAAEVGAVGANAALYFPRIRGMGAPVARCVAGAVAGVIARTDAERGVWSAPAGREAALVGVRDLAVDVSDDDVAWLAALGVNGLRAVPGSGVVVWGARTCAGGDAAAATGRARGGAARGGAADGRARGGAAGGGEAPEVRYLPVRRTTLHVEQSLARGLAWAVFEPNGEPLWAQIRARVAAFLDDLYRAGAFLGRSAREAYFVRCGRDTTPQADIDRGVVTVEVGFAAIKPAEFVVVRITQATAPPR